MPGAIWQVVLGNFSEKSVRLVWDLDSRDDPLMSLFSAFCIAHDSLSCGLLKKGQARNVAWQSLSGAKQKLRQGFLWGREGENLKKAFPDKYA